MKNIMDIVNEKRCTGCSLCVYSCPKQIINLRQDEAGFYVATINDADSCIECGICLKKCCINNIKTNRSLKPQAVRYGWSNELRENATSGGGGFGNIFSLFKGRWRCFWCVFE